MRVLNSSRLLLAALYVLTSCQGSLAFIPLIDGGKGMPKLYDGWFNEQIVKQANTAVSKAISSGKKKIEVNFPPVPNVEEVKFGTPLNQKFGKDILAKDLKIVGGYRPGSNLSRNLIAYSNVYWAKKIASAVKGGGLGGKPACILSTEPVKFSEIKSMGSLSRSGKLMSEKARKEGKSGEVVICANPGGEEAWDRFVSAHGTPEGAFVMLNNAYSTSYDLGNKRGFEEAYFLKRISKGWVFRAFPGPWEAYLEKPDGSVELLRTYKSKPLLREVATEVREESFKRYAISNDRWSQGFGGRL